MKFTIWTPGGNCAEEPKPKAIKLIRNLWDKKVSSLGWERREAGTDLEETWENNGYQHNKLKTAVNAALPHWKQIGLTQEQAALVCFDIGLVLSTGAEEDED